jgi:hypothetical protein
MKKKKNFGLITLVLITFLIFGQVAFVSAITGSMGNARMILYPEVNGITNTIIEKSILVKNVNDVPITIKLEVEEDSTDFLELVDEEVTLEPGTNKRMEFQVKVKKPGKYEGKINVYFSEAEGEGPGVALASNIIVIAKNPKDSQIDEEPEEEQENEIDSEENDPITGEVTGKGEGNGTGALLITTTVILIIALIALYLWSEKKQKKKVEEIKTKKSKKSNETSKKKTKK